MSPTFAPDRCPPHFQIRSGATVLQYAVLVFIQLQFFSCLYFLFPLPICRDAAFHKSRKRRILTAERERERESDCMVGRPVGGKHVSSGRRNDNHKRQVSEWIEFNAAPDTIKRSFRRRKQTTGRRRRDSAAGSWWWYACALWTRSRRSQGCCRWCRGPSRCRTESERSPRTEWMRSSRRTITLPA